MALTPLILDGLELLRRFWYVLPIAGLAAYAWSLSGQVDDLGRDLRAERSHSAALELRNGVTSASLSACSAQLDDNSRRVSDAAAQLERTRVAAAADRARSDERWKGTAAEVAGLLEASKGAPGCEPSAAALKTLEKL